METNIEGLWCRKNEALEYFKLFCMRNGKHKCSQSKRLNLLVNWFIFSNAAEVLQFFQNTFRCLIGAFFKIKCVFVCLYIYIYTYIRVRLNRPWFVIHEEVLSFHDRILRYHEPFHDKIKNKNHGSYQWICDV